MEQRKVGLEREEQNKMYIQITWTFQRKATMLKGVSVNGEERESERRG